MLQLGIQCGKCSGYQGAAAGVRIADVMVEARVRIAEGVGCVKGW